MRNRSEHPRSSCTPNAKKHPNTIMQTQHEKIPPLQISTLENGLLRLQDEDYSADAVIDLHPVQVRLIAERIGLIQPGNESGPTIAEQARDLDRLKRNMLRVREHALQLQHGFANHADWKHADLAHDMGKINALVDLLDMAVDDFADDYTAKEPEQIATCPSLPTACTDAHAAQPSLL